MIQTNNQASVWARSLSSSSSIFKGFRGGEVPAASNFPPNTVFNPKVTQ